jgi:GntR family transcriptional regulator
MHKLVNEPSTHRRELMPREALYLQVADDLRCRITSGEWAVGDRVPSGAALAEECGVGRNVTQRALERLVIEGLARLRV